MMKEWLGKHAIFPQSKQATRKKKRRKTKAGMGKEKEKRGDGYKIAQERSIRASRLSNEWRELKKERGRRRLHGSHFHFFFSAFQPPTGLRGWRGI
jgi:hypothetical protein